MTSVVVKPPAHYYEGAPVSLTSSSVASELLGLGPGAPVPAGHGVVKRTRHQLLLVKLDCGAGVSLDPINTLASAHIP